MAKEAAAAAAASSSSPPPCFTNPWTSDVFLSFRGEDTRCNFTGHLCRALRQKGINTFMDDCLSRGEEISTALLKAIEESRISVIVFSENYASSRWCLDELVKILDCEKSNQQMVIPVFYKVSPSDVRNQKGCFGDGLAGLECKYKDNVDKIHKWRPALSEAGNLSGWTLLDKHEDESKLIHNIVEGISARVINRTYLDVAEYPVGIESRAQEIKNRLHVGRNDVRMVGLWGMGGIGKSTIAKAVYNLISHKFEGSCFLNKVRESSMTDKGLAKLQKTLLYEILGGDKLNVANVDKGITLIKERLSSKRILLVLDDVNDMRQLRCLAGGSDGWFGIGSRIIITTRDKKLLTAHHHNISIYEVKKLNYHEALELFSWNAFKSNGPLDGYAKLADHAIRCAQGLPLALRVLGSHLYRVSIDQWQAILDGLIKSREIQDVFKINYDALDEIVKEVFLDIACFFKGGSSNYVIEILEGCELNPKHSIDVLIQKALVNIDHGFIWMHDLVEEMGKEVVRQQSPNDPGERSRLWFHDDVYRVLTENTGTKNITGIKVQLLESDNEICLSATTFSNMKNLKIFINCNGRFSGAVDYLPNNLRLVDWPECPLKSLPLNFNPKNLVVLNMRNSQITGFREGFKNLTKLILSGCQYLTRISDFSGVPNLVTLDLNGCTNLTEVDPSVRFLDKLEELCLVNCYNLAVFPTTISWKSLRTFNLGGCKKFEIFPEIVGKMERLEDLPLGGTAIKELPPSIKNLIGLKRLSLDRCKNFANLPQSIYALPRLEYLRLRQCAKLVTLPPDLPTTSNISPDNFGSVAIPNLGTMLFDECNLSDIDTLANFGCSSKLKEILLHASNIESLPACIGKFVWLEILSLFGCKKLREISELPPKIRWIDVGDCTLLEIFPTLSEMIRGDGDVRLIRWMQMSSCQRLCEKLALDVSMMASVLLHQAGKCNEAISIVLPGSEVPNWFSCRKDVRVKFRTGRSYEIFIEIPRTFKWKNTVLVFCAAFKITQNFSGTCWFCTWAEVDGVSINDPDRTDCLFQTNEIDAAHVWLKYIPLPARIKSHVDEGGDQSEPYLWKSVHEGGDQSKPYLCQVTLFHRDGDGLLLNGYGVHLGNFRRPEDGGEDDDDVGGEDGDEDDDDVGDGDEDDDDEGGEDGDEDDDDVGGEVGPRKRKRMLAIKS
ncbi:disease resistance protein RPV1-like isoform X2 [Pyrus x bretschneideri]|uniref:disease resistance protein RPV1-like isoform X2 n=1 Tax=Pyrus x bretschneideri TaxID=225117 RepID=UPI002030C705|nr:disease resistance protein RPV1-like isoform X2 [Pyrus x bretschneideri]